MRSTCMRMAAVAAGLIGACAAGPALAQTGAAGWYGTYEYSETVPRTGVTGVIDYRLTLSPGGCRLDAEGVMTNLHVRCTARMSGNSLQVNFLNHVDSSARDARLRPGVPMLRLTRTPQGLVTTWQAVTRSDARRTSGRYFRKRLS